MILFFKIVQKQTCKKAVLFSLGEEDLTAAVSIHDEKPNVTSCPVNLCCHFIAFILLSSLTKTSSCQIQM